MWKGIAGIILGYAIFAFSALLFFHISGHDPHARATTLFQAVTLLVGAFFSLLSGVVVQLIAKPRNLMTNYILAIIIAGFAAFSLIKSEGSHWTQLMTIIAFAPLSVTGGQYVARRRICNK
jgi:hypothetical protein